METGKEVGEEPRTHEHRWKGTALVHGDGQVPCTALTRVLPTTVTAGRSNGVKCNRPSGDQDHIHAHTVSSRVLKFGQMNTACANTYYLSSHGFKTLGQCFFCFNSKLSFLWSLRGQQIKISDKRFWTRSLAFKLCFREGEGCGGGLCVTLTLCLDEPSPQLTENTQQKHAWQPSDRKCLPASDFCDSLVPSESRIIEQPLKKCF